MFSYSDGITEATNGQTRLGSGRFIQLLEQTRSRPLDGSVLDCVNGLKRWCNRSPLRDDLTLLALEIPD